LIWYVPAAPKNGEFWFTLLDVGQGLASVLRTEHHVLVYDTGLRLFTTNSGEIVVNPFLRYFGIYGIDTLLVSHGDSDHIGGANSIFSCGNSLSSYN